MTVTTCYVFANANYDSSTIESIIATHKDQYTTFIFDSKELGACLIPLHNGSASERAYAKHVDAQLLYKTPPDMFVTIEETDDNCITQQIKQIDHTNSYIAKLNEVLHKYIETGGVIISIVCFAKTTNNKTTKL